MNSSPYDWEMFYLEPDTDFSLLVAKLREKSWDVVMVGSKQALSLSPSLFILFVSVNLRDQR